MTALYIHIPFCHSRCAYCGFNTYAGLDDLMPAYVDAVCSEIINTPQVRGHSIFFGGGTPSILPLNLLSQLLDQLRSRFNLQDLAEISLEANPGTITPAYMAGLHEIGINRLSLGFQSSHNNDLLLLGRTHTWIDCLRALEAARDAGLTNLNLDLLYGLPGQTSERWLNTIKAALDLEPSHLSLYALKIEPGTLLEHKITCGELDPPDEDIAAEMYELAEITLAKAGYFHYEISNWAKSLSSSPQTENAMWWPCPQPSSDMDPILSEDISPFVSRHNLTYWRNESYLGFGAGASSWMNGKRWTNVQSLQDYISKSRDRSGVIDLDEDIPRQLEMGETMMMGLRLAEGISDRRFRTRFQIGLERSYGQELTRLSELGLLQWESGTARLTPRGRLLGNQVFECFLPN